ncbi:MAG: SprB repeat-containing protein [Lewinellaceae bacterium]|nr:SprB repeat-containing protein [Lewinellaceae bacterium]
MQYRRLPEHELKRPGTPGQYHATITDGIGLYGGSYSHGSRRQRHNAGSGVTPAACANGTDGAISLIVSGGSGQSYAYAWSPPAIRAFSFPAPPPTSTSGCTARRLRIMQAARRVGAGRWYLADTEYPYIRKVEAWVTLMHIVRDIDIPGRMAGNSSRLPEICKR